jgi:Uma2 family endonuclease
MRLAKAMALEKFLSYTQIESLQEYVLIAQDRMEVTLFRRAKKWQPEAFLKPDEPLRVDSLKFAMPFSSVYEGVKPPVA